MRDKAELCPPAPVMQDSWYKIKQNRTSEQDPMEPTKNQESKPEIHRNEIVVVPSVPPEAAKPEWRLLSFHRGGDQQEVETIKYRARDIGIVKGMINNKIELPSDVNAILDPKNRQILVLHPQKITLVGRGCLWKPNFITSTDKGNIAVFDLHEKAMKVFDTSGNYLAQIDENSSQVWLEN